MIKKKRGDFGEIAVCDYLVKRGCTIAERNYRKRSGEIDIIAISGCGNEVVFVEVKTRKFGGLTEGVDAVNNEKRRRIVKTARAFLVDNPQFYNMNSRFDVAGVVITTDETPSVLEIEYYEDAFNPALL